MKLPRRAHHHLSRPTYRPHVVIIGAGFGGLNAARALRRAPVQLTVIDRKNHHLFQPLLYEVATGGVSTDAIARPIRRILRHQANTEVLLAEARSVDLARQRVVLEGGEMTYDYLVIATGASHSYFGHDEWAQLAPGLKSLDDAVEIRRRIFTAFEYAEREDNPAERKRWMSFVIIGGGPTGVELAGTLAEIARDSLSTDFRRIDSRHARIILLEGLPRVLPNFPEDLSEKAREQLERLGVEVHTKTMVTSIDAEGVTAGSERFDARTVLWAAGVAASPLARSLGVPLDRAGRVKVEPDLTVPGHPEAFVIGDLASVIQDGQPVPGLAPAAIQEGRYVAAVIRDDLSTGRRRAPFRYRDKGLLATIGRAAAVAAIGRLRLSGTPAWLAWLFVHIAFLIGFRNRAIVLFDWAIAYLAYERGARLIIESAGQKRQAPHYVAPPPIEEAPAPKSLEAHPESGPASLVAAPAPEVVEEQAPPSPS